MTTVSGTSARPLFSVVIPTFNRRSVLSETLVALAGQENAPEFEVVVVDDGSTDGTGAWLETASFPYSLKTLSQQNLGPAAARNAGVQLTTGRWIAFLGDDTVPAPDWLAAHSMAHETAGSGEPLAVIGYTDWHPSLQITPLMRFLNAKGLQFGFDIIEDPTDVPFNFFYASNISLPRHLLLEHPFDEAFSEAVWEDIELGFRLTTRAGMRIVYDDGAVTHHRHPTTFARFARRQERAGYVAVQVYEKHPELGSFLSLAPTGPRALPVAWLMRPMCRLVPLMAGGPSFMNVIWERAFHFHYLMGLHKAWAERQSSSAGE